MNWVWNHSSSKGSERLVLLAIADCANDEGVSWPSIATIAKKCHLSRRYVIDILAKLEKSGELSIIQRKESPTKNQSNLYKINQVVNPASPGSEAYLTRGSEPPLTRGSEAESTRVVRHTSPKPPMNHQLITDQEEPPRSSAGEPAKKAPPPLSSGQQYFLQALGATKYKTTKQRDGVLALEQQFGLKKLRDGVDWAAKRGMNLGGALLSLEKALPNWGQTKTNGNGSRAGPPAQPGIRDYMKSGQWKKDLEDGDD
jgi:hypothetical protein